MFAPVDDMCAAMLTAWRAGCPARVIALASSAVGSVCEDERFLALLGVAQQATSAYAEAAASFRKLVGMCPGVSSYWNNLGEAYRQLGEYEEAAQAFEKALVLLPNDAEVHYNLGLLHASQRDWRAARVDFLDAVRLRPGFVDARREAAHACHVCGDVASVTALLRDVGQWPPQPVKQALTLAAVLTAGGRPSAALRVLKRAWLPDGPACQVVALRVCIDAQIVAIHERCNQLADARKALQRIPLATLNTLPAGAVDARTAGWRAHAVIAGREGRYADAAELYRQALGTAAGTEQRVAAAFGRAKALDRLTRYRDAWETLAVAHALQAQSVRDVAPELSSPTALALPLATQYVDAAAYARWQPLLAPSARDSPVFVIGFPRSGTTLLEQMVDAHPDFQSMDERGFIQDLITRMRHAGQRYPADLACLAQTDVDQLRSVYFAQVDTIVPQRRRRRLVDKNPLNMLALPMIQRLFPDAPIVLCLRHPCDVVLSCRMQAFRSPAFMALCSSIDRLARGYANAFAQCCAHLDVFRPRVLEWRYESAVDDVGRELARLARFLSVSNAASMADFARHARAKPFIATPSYADVTRPLNHGSIGRWKAYHEYFEPVLPILRPWIERLGYATRRGM
ncbi:MAG TPA: sulfotransferase [Rhodanobacteraceae bacterium]